MVQLARMRVDEATKHCQCIISYAFCEENVFENGRNFASVGDTEPRTRLVSGSIKKYMSKQFYTMND